MFTCWVTATYNVFPGTVGSDSIETTYSGKPRFFHVVSSNVIVAEAVTTPYHTLYPSHQNPNYTTGSRSKGPGKGF